MPAICAEQLKEFLKAGWIFRETAETAAPVLMVRKPNADASSCKHSQRPGRGGGDAGGGSPQLTRAAARNISDCIHRTFQ
jgi:hypothetical protein